MSEVTTEGDKAHVLPFVSIIMPAFNEQKYICGTILSLLKNGYPLNKIEFVIVDGESEDETIKLAESLLTKWNAKFSIITNSARITPVSLNLAIILI